MMTTLLLALLLSLLLSTCVFTNHVLSVRHSAFAAERVVSSIWASIFRLFPPLSDGSSEKLFTEAAFRHTWTRRAFKAFICLCDEDTVAKVLIECGVFMLSRFTWMYGAGILRQTGKFEYAILVRKTSSFLGRNCFQDKRLICILYSNPKTEFTRLTQNCGTVDTRMHSNVEGDECHAIWTWQKRKRKSYAENFRHKTKISQGKI